MSKEENIDDIIDILNTGIKENNVELQSEALGKLADECSKMKNERQSTNKAN